MCGFRYLHTTTIRMVRRVDYLLTVGTYAVRLVFKMTNTMTPAEQFENARKRLADAEARNLSQSTINKRWREYFAAEDAVKSSHGAWA